MASAITDLLDRVTDSTTGRPVIGAMAAPGKALAAASINLADATNWTTTTAIHFSIYNTVVAGGLTVKDTTTQTDWKGTLAGTTISNLTLTGGTDRTYTAGAIVEITPTARYAKDLYELIISFANQDGSLKAAPIQTALNLGASSLNGYTALGYAPNTVTNNGNRSYDLVFNAIDLTGTLSPGMRLRTTRTVAAPTQCTSLNGTTQNYSKTAPAGMTFTDDFVVGGWVKLSSYPTGAGTIASRYNGTSGWSIDINSSGQVRVYGFNAGAANTSSVSSYQSLPLNKLVHIAAQLDMSAFTATPTTSYVMIDGADVPTTVARTGTNPTALVQAGNLEIGSSNAINLFPGKISQAFVTSAKLTQAQVKAIYSQGITTADTATYSMVSAYSFNNVITDLNTTNANNLTANGAAVATNADSPFGTQASGLISSTLDYAIVQAATFSTNTTVTVQVPEGCTIPTSGGVSAVVYSSNKVPYGFPTSRNRWRLVTLLKTDVTATSNATYGAFSSGGFTLNVPVGEWTTGWMGQVFASSTTSLYFNLSSTVLTGMTVTQGLNASRYSTRVLSTAAATVLIIDAYKQQQESLSSQTSFVMYSLGATTAGGVIGSDSPVEIFAENAYL